MDFPASPSLGQTFTPSGGPTYTWDGAKWGVSNTVPIGTAISGRLSNYLNFPIVQEIAGATSIYWNPYLGNFMPIWNGNAFIWQQIPGVLTNVLANAATGNAGPAAVAAQTTYDVFIWSAAGTFTLTRGPAWANSTAGSGARGTGAGTTELNLVNGIWVNKFAITNGPAAGYGTYIGSFTTDGSGTLSYTATFKAVTGGWQNNISIWNMYNRVDVCPAVSDLTATWTQATYNSYVPTRNTNGTRINFTAGLVEDGFYASMHQMGSYQSPNIPNIAIGLNSQNSRTGSSGRNANASGITMCAQCAAFPALGSNFITGLEMCEGASGTLTFYGGVAGANWQSVLAMKWRA